MSNRRVNGATVRALREALGIKHGDLALRCGFTPSFLSHVESGAKQPSPTKAREIANQLGVPLDAITYPVLVAA